MAYFEWNLRRSDNNVSDQKIQNFIVLPEFIINIAQNRGIKSYTDFMEFAFPQIFSLPSPFQLSGIDKAVSRIRQAIENNESILIFGDKDADGVTATAIMHRIISKFNGKIDFRVPEGDEHYGISNTAIDDAKKRDISLIITVDCGISAVEETEYAKSLGIDLIITDHHEPPEILPNAFVLINPKLNNYHFPHLAGAGVALKLAHALAESFFLTEYNQEFVFFDLETTGLDLEQDEITEIAAIITKNGVEIDHFQCLVKVSKPLDPKIVEITNITDEMLAAEGISIVDALTKFIEFIGNRTLVGHNIIGFDMKFLQIQLKRHLQKEIHNLPIDTLLLSRVMFKNLKSHTLFSVSEHLGIYIDQSQLHRALNDVRLNAEVYRRILIKRSTPLQNILSELMPLAAIGTVADMMPLQDENRVIVKIGLHPEHIKLTTTGLIILLKRLEIIDKIDAKTISWTLGPIINSPGRLGEASLVVSLLTTTNINHANQLVEELIKKDRERKELISSFESEILNSINIDTINQRKHIFIVSHNISRGLTGLIATKLTNQFHVPVIIVSVMTDGQASGSLRATGEFNIVHMLQELSHLFIRFGGHKSAGGFVIKEESLPQMEEQITSYMEQWSPENFKNPLDIDIEISDLSVLNTTNINYIKKLFNPIGCSNPSPNFLITNVSLVEQRYIGKNKDHLIFVFRKDSFTFNVIAWGFAERWNLIKNCKSFDLVGIPEINEWNNTQEVRLQLIDIEGK
ncbi:MAG: single-stranded-DNA-specific exonuclease RecJ [Brevinemataceae bacterium]